LDEYSWLLCFPFSPYPLDDTSDVEAQEQEIPGGVYYDVETVDDQE
jgi:hypothetical protein